MPARLQVPCSLAIALLWLGCSSQPSDAGGLASEPPTTSGGAGAVPPSISAEPTPPVTSPTPDGEGPAGVGAPPLVAAPSASSSRADAGSDGETAAAPPDAGPAITSTHGSGGTVGPAELRSSRGLRYRIDAPDAAGPHGLLVLLHGSTASNYENFVPMMQQVAQRHDLIAVSVLAPNGQGWNEGDQVAAAELLHSLVQDDLYRQYDIDTSRVLFSGQSSGGGFLASNFVPAHAQDYAGGAFFQCGAAPPNIPFAPDADTRQSFRLHFEITTEDPIWPDYYAAALVAYRDAGMSLTEDSTKPGGHCQFDQQQVILDHIDFVLGR